MIDGIGLADGLNEVKIGVLPLAWSIIEDWF